RRQLVTSSAAALAAAGFASDVQARTPGWTRLDQPADRGPLRVIIDTDPGVDDALALLLAMRSPELRIEGITPVSGNVPLEVTLLTLGPLTNIATALNSDPQLASMVHNLVMMGGSLSGGNITPAAEFNIYVDPEAARIVFQSGIPITMVGLDVTRKTSLTEDS